MKMFARNESGTTAIEYGLIVALIAVTIVTAVGQLSQNMQNNLYALIATLP